MVEALLVIGGFFIGMLGVLFGGSMFLSLPFFQILFPSLNYGQVVGNIKIGSFFRSFASSISTKKYILFKEILPLSLPFLAGSFIGSLIIVSISPLFLFLAVFIGIIMSELSPKITHAINKKTRILIGFLIGLYGAFIGAGISIFIVALLRTYFPNKDQLVFVKIQSNFVELMGTFIILIIQLFYGNVIWKITLFWSMGMFVGGYVGGHVLKKTIHISASSQKIYIYIVYATALIPLLIKLF